MIAWRTAPLQAGAYAIVAIALFVFVGKLSVDPVGLDFVAFYCGGAAVAVGADPYRTEPLRTCEHRVRPDFTNNGSRYVVPDPIPPYDQAAFALAARLPIYPLWLLLIMLQAAACAGSIVLLARITGQPLVNVGAALLSSDFICSAPLGQIVPFCVLGIIVSGWALVNEKYIALGIGLTLAMLEPHLGAAALLGASIWGGRYAALTAIIALVSLGTLSLFAMPIGTILEYAFRVLPAHAASEINNQGQYSLSYQMHGLGLSIIDSLRFSSVVFLLLLIASVVIVGRARSVFGLSAIVFVPCAAVLAGSPFLHLAQMAAAIPAAVLVSVRCRSRVAGFAVALLSIPWFDFTWVVRLGPVIAFGFFTTLRKFAYANFRLTLLLTLAAVVFLIFGASFEATHGIGEVVSYGFVLPSDLPETVWKTIVDAQEHRYPLLAQLAKMPTEVALVLLGFIIIRECTDTGARKRPNYESRGNVLATAGIGPR